MLGKYNYRYQPGEALAVAKYDMYMANTELKEKLLRAAVKAIHQEIADAQDFSKSECELTFDESKEYFFRVEWEGLKEFMCAYHYDRWYPTAHEPRILSI
jgi:hypothetical protein